LLYKGDGREKTVNQQQQQQIDEAAQKFAEVLMKSPRTTSDLVSAQQLNAKLTQQFCKAVIDKLRSQTRGGQETEGPSQRMERGLEEMTRRLEELDSRLEEAKAASRHSRSEGTSGEQQS
jgi:predicted RNase H-like nuclease (RuvC/YqgF family)